MELFFDITIMTLLLVTIVFAWKLNSKLNLIRNHKLELKANIEAFYAATEKANKAVTDLQKQGKDLCKEIDQKISKARIASDEIDFMVTRARKTLLSINEQREVSPARQEPIFSQPRPQPKIMTREQQIEQRLRAANNDRAQRYDEDEHMSLSEQELLKVMREREYKQALMG